MIHISRPVFFMKHGPNKKTCSIRTCRHEKTILWAHLHPLFIPNSCSPLGLSATLACKTKKRHKQFSDRTCAEGWVGFCDESSSPGFFLVTARTMDLMLLRKIGFFLRLAGHPPGGGAGQTQSPFVDKRLLGKIAGCRCCTKNTL